MAEQAIIRQHLMKSRALSHLWTIGARLVEVRVEVACENPPTIRPWLAERAEQVGQLGFQHAKMFVPAFWRRINLPIAQIATPRKHDPRQCERTARCPENHSDHPSRVGDWD